VIGRKCASYTGMYNTKHSIACITLTALRWYVIYIKHEDYKPTTDQEYHFIIIFFLIVFLLPEILKSQKEQNKCYLGKGTNTVLC